MCSCQAEGFETRNFHKLSSDVRGPFGLEACTSSLSFALQAISCWCGSWFAKMKFWIGVLNPVRCWATQVFLGRLRLFGLTMVKSILWRLGIPTACPLEFITNLLWPIIPIRTVLLRVWILHSLNRIASKALVNEREASAHYLWPLDSKRLLMKTMSEASKTWKLEQR